MNDKTRKQKTFVKKQCNIGKYKKFNGIETFKDVSNKNNFQNLSFRQTNIFRQPISCMTSMPLTSVKPLLENNCNRLSFLDANNLHNSEVCLVKQRGIKKKYDAEAHQSSTEKMGNFVPRTKFYREFPLSNLSLRKENRIISKDVISRGNLPINQDFPVSSSDHFTEPQRINDENVFLSAESGSSSPKMTLTDLDHFSELDLLPHKLEHFHSFEPTKNVEKCAPAAREKNSNISTSVDMNVLDVDEDLRICDLDSLPYGDCVENVSSKSIRYRKAKSHNVSTQLPPPVLPSTSFSASQMSESLVPSHSLPILLQANSKKVQFQLSSFQNDSSDHSSALPSPLQNAVDSMENISNDTDSEVTLLELEEKIQPTFNHQMQYSSLPVLLQTNGCPLSNDSQQLNFASPSQSENQNLKRKLFDAVAESSCILKNVTLSGSVPNACNDNEEYSCEMLSEEEDILRSSLSRFSFSSSHLAPLGTSLKLLKLHRLLQPRSDAERENIMSIYR